MVAASELSINTGANAMAMAQSIFGDGVTVVGASYSGSSYSSGVYSGGDATSPGVVPGDSGVILSTGRAEDFTNTFGVANQRGNTSTNSGGQNNNPDFNALAGTNTYDASILDVDFIPTTDTMTIQFVFASDEFPEFSSSVYNDAVGVWVNGNFVPMVVGNGSASVGNVNQSDNTNLFQDNTASPYNTEMDGFTLAMTLTIPVNAGVVNSIRIGIADVSDSSYDSNLLIAADSIQTTLIANDDQITMGVTTTKTLDILANDDNNTAGTLIITHINGVAVTAGDSVTMTSGDVVTLNADGTLSITTDADADTFNFTYKTASVDGSNAVLQTDIGFVTVETIPCFVAGTMVLTPTGEVRVEDLTPGDQVVTRDDGNQPLRWIGQRQVPAEGKLAPIKIEEGALGDHETLFVSPQHRILVRDSLAELLFGETEVLVAAKDLVNDRTITRQEGGYVDYVHLLFDRHQVIYSEGLPTESFLPGPQMGKSWEKEALEEICAIFPEIDFVTGGGYSPAARRTLRSFEAQVLIARSLVA